jgi:hypothetical protein
MFCTKTTTAAFIRRRKRFCALGLNSQDDLPKTYCGGV